MSAAEPSQHPPDPLPNLARVRALAAPIDSLLPLAGAVAVMISSTVLVTALFLPWYDLPIALQSESDGEFSPRVADRPNGWESFRYADVLLSSIAAIGIGSTLAAFALRFRAPFGVSALAGWIGVALVIYSYYRPAFGAGAATYPAEGYFVALCATGAIGGASLVALLAGSRDADASAPEQSEEVGIG